MLIKQLDKVPLVKKPFCCILFCLKRKALNMMPTLGKQLAYTVNQILFSAILVGNLVRSDSFF